MVKRFHRRTRHRPQNRQRLRQACAAKPQIEQNRHHAEIHGRISTTNLKNRSQHRPIHNSLVDFLQGTADDGPLHKRIRVLR